MKVTTSITLSENVLKEVDDFLDYPEDRSTLIEQAIREYIERQKGSSRGLRALTDLELINNSAEDLNKEAEDILSYQVAI